MADGNSDIGFARLCFIAGVQASAAQKSYELSSGIAEHDPRSAPNLESNGSSWMQTSGWIRNAAFYEPNFHLHFQLKSYDVCFQ